MPDSCFLKMIWRLNCCWCSSFVKWPKLCSISVADWNPCVQRWRSQVGSSCNSARLSLDLWTQLRVVTPQLQYTSQVQNTGRSRDPNILWSRLRSTQNQSNPNSHVILILWNRLRKMTTKATNHILHGSSVLWRAWKTTKQPPHSTGILIFWKLQRQQQSSYRVLKGFLSYWSFKRQQQSSYQFYRDPQYYGGCGQTDCILQGSSSYGSFEDHNRATAL